MKKQKQAYMLTAALLAATSAHTQTTHTRLLLPDGSPIGWDKVDSIKEVWGAERVRYTHNEEDDKNNVMRLYRLTDADLKALKEAAEKRERARKAMIGQPAPTFTIKDINGKEWSLPALKGKVAVFNFWFTSCPPCISEMPHLNSLVEKYKGKDVVFLAFTFNDQHLIKPFLQQHPFDYTVIPLSGDIDTDYKITSWPASFVIDKTSTVKLITDYDPDIDVKLSAAIDNALR